MIISLDLTDIELDILRDSLLGNQQEIHKEIARKIFEKTYTPVDLKKQVSRYCERERNEYQGGRK